MFSLDNDREQTLLNTQTECCFMWTTGRETRLESS